MGLLRTILALVMLLILVHLGLVYLDIEASTNVVTQTVYSVGVLVESPATLILGAIGGNLPDALDPDSFAVIALTAVLAYFILYILLGVGSRS